MRGAAFRSSYYIYKCWWYFFTYRKWSRWILVPANDPYQMAYEIIKLSKDVEKLEEMSVKGKMKATERHNPSNIILQLKECYQNVIRDK